MAADAADAAVTRISFVCTGNICRSPTAEVVLRRQAAAAGVDVEVESAGTGGWHVGQGADERSAATMAAHGYDASNHRARRFDHADFARLDLVVALDAGHLRELRALAPDDEARAKVVLLGSYSGDGDVPDPYYGGPGGFEDVLARVERACAALLASLGTDPPGP